MKNKKKDGRGKGRQVSMYCAKCHVSSAVHHLRKKCQKCGTILMPVGSKPTPELIAEVKESIGDIMPSLEQGTDSMVSVIAPQEKLMLEEMANAVFSKKAVTPCFSHNCRHFGKIRCLQCAMHYCELHMARESSSGEICHLCYKPMPRWFARIVQELMKR